MEIQSDSVLKKIAHPSVRRLSLVLFCTSLLALNACKRCYDCTTITEIEYDDQQANSVFGTESSYEIILCERKKVIEAYESEHSNTVESSDYFGGAYTSTSTTTCIKQ